MGLLCRIRNSYGAFRLLRRVSRLINCFCRRFDRERNCLLRSEARLPEGLLNGQELQPVSELPYGAWRMGKNGCEVIAAYNALTELGRPRPLAEIAEELEKSGLLFNGFGGTNPLALPGFFRKNGVAVCLLRGRERSRYDAGFAGADCGVLCFWTGKTLRRRDGSWNTLHTVSVHHGEGGVLLCNASGSGRQPARYPSMERFMAETGAVPLCLMLLKRERS